MERATRIEPAFSVREGTTGIQEWFEYYLIKRQITTSKKRPSLDVGGFWILSVS